MDDPALTERFLVLAPTGRDGPLTCGLLERAELRAVVSTAHGRGQRVRFWATPDIAGPDRDAVWGELLAAGVDHLNTDDLAGLEVFLRARQEAAPAA